jgi:hypothetical protein
MPQAHTKPKTENTKTETTANGTTPARKPSEQALEVVDVTFGAVPRVAEVVRNEAEKLRDSSAREQELKSLQRQVEKLRNPRTRSAEIEVLRKRLDVEVAKAKAEGPVRRRKVTKQVVDQAKRARGRVEPVYGPVYKRVEPVYKRRVEPLVKQRVEPTYRQRVEPTVKRVLERV